MRTRLTPLEIQKMRFTQKMRGYDPTEVEGFLAVIAEEVAAEEGATHVRVGTALFGPRQGSH